ncbi:GDP-L-fucose synthase family protein [Desulfococcus sp.]|uniref:GDP-L-fucose synthase family protein n=1 Tax=Desulfococcus sp. TaxID=2025834 RepID=UPI003593BE79
MDRSAKIYVAGHRGLVGEAICRRLASAGYGNVIRRTRKELDLTRQDAVEAFFREERPEYVFLAAAKVGGIHANNTFPAEFIYQNLAIQTHLIHASHRFGARRLLFLGSSCIYPRDCPQPMKEAHLLTGPLEPTNSPYAVAKISGIEMCWAYNRQHQTCFIPVMPTNLYGINDNFNLETSHVLPAMIRKFHLARLAAEKNWEAVAKDEALYGPIPADIQAALGMGGGSRGGSEPVVRLWGTGSPKREFLYVDDLADACLFVMNHGSIDRIMPPAAFLLNIGTGEDLTIRELALAIARVVGFDGAVEWDPDKPDGTPRKLLDVSRMTALGWRAGIRLEEGLKKTYEGYVGRY